MRDIWGGKATGCWKGSQGEVSTHPHMPQFPLKMLQARANTKGGSSETQLCHESAVWCDFPPTPSPLWVSSPSKTQRWGLGSSEISSSCDEIGEHSSEAGCPFTDGHLAGISPCPSSGHSYFGSLSLSLLPGPPKLLPSVRNRDRIRHTHPLSDRLSLPDSRLPRVPPPHPQRGKDLAHMRVLERNWG